MHTLNIYFPALQIGQMVLVWPIDTLSIRVPLSASSFLSSFSMWVNQKQKSHEFFCFIPTSLISAHTRVLHCHPSSIMSVAGTCRYLSSFFNHRIRLILYQVVFGAYLSIGTWVGSAVKWVTEGGVCNQEGGGCGFAFFWVSLSTPPGFISIACHLFSRLQSRLGAFFFRLSSFDIHISVLYLVAF